ncbi:N-acetyltransferase [Peribacillus psychrosaccharolyticus]|uniref:GNAT family N-acetyltransferase n=1 Tax=Peribacillus psychrosaccharolyticus TaxID=1407 RepID=UPI003D2946A5
MNIEELSAFIADVNSQPKNHTGYCGSDRKEIQKKLEEDFSDLELEDSFIVISENKQLIAALGFDVDRKKQSAEIWGPFILNSDHWTEQTSMLWNEFMKKTESKKIGTYFAFYHEENKKGIRWMESLNAKETGKHQILVSKTEVTNGEILEEISPPFYEEVIKLHNELFPETYLTGADMISDLSEEKRLLIIPDGDQSIQGYVYLEGDSVFQEGNLEFIAVEREHQKKGLGKKLVQAGLTYLYENMNVAEVSLCVNVNNAAAINLYKKSGFHEEMKLVSFKVSV